MWCLLFVWTFHRAVNRTPINYNNPEKRWVWKIGRVSCRIRRHRCRPQKTLPRQVNSHCAYVGTTLRASQSKPRKKLTPIPCITHSVTKVKKSVFTRSLSWLADGMWRNLEDGFFFVVRFRKEMGATVRTRDRCFVIIYLDSQLSYRVTMGRFFKVTIKYLLNFGSW